MSFLIGLGIVSVAQLTSSCSDAQTSFSFTQIADTTSRVPDGSEVFSRLGQAVIDDGRVAFAGVSNAGNGIFTALSGGAVETAIHESSLFLSPGSSFGNLSIRDLI